MRNRYISRAFATPDENAASRLEISRFPLKTQHYIQEAVGTVEALLGKGSIHTVVLFGSLAYCQMVTVSDVDLLIIVNNSVNRRQIQQIEGILKAVEIKHKFGEYPADWVAVIMRIIERTTGMFVSHFVCRFADWEKRDFPAIFNTNRLITVLLAPDRIVLDSMKAGACVLYGHVDLSNFYSSYALTQMLKSLAMDLLIALGTLVILPFNPANSKYMLESLKWALKSGYFYLFQRNLPISKLAEFYAKIGLSLDYINRFQELRINPVPDLHFGLINPIEIFRLYVLTLKLKSFRK